MPISFGAKPLPKSFALLFLAFCALVITACIPSKDSDRVPRAVCGPGSQPESGMQGQVTYEDRQSGRSTEGYSCNLKRVGHYQGTGSATFGNAYQNCMYSGSMGLGSLRTSTPGVQVVDFSDLNNPKLTAILGTHATSLGTWETLRVHEGRELLVGAGVPLVWGGNYLSLFDLSQGCEQPKLLNGLNGAAEGATEKLSFAAHEANLSPDGMTYWTTANVPGYINAIDISDPTKPEVIFGGLTGISNHGFSFSPDGRLLYIASEFPAGMSVFDVSDIQDRKPNPQIRLLDTIHWIDGLISQMAVPFERNGKKYLIAADEAQSGGVRLLDVSNPRDIKHVRKYELEINRTENIDIRRRETITNGAFGYEAHYCQVNQYKDPQWLACSYVQSGIRVFDIADPLQPKEIAYYNPPTQPGSASRLINSAHATSPLPYPYVSDFNICGTDEEGNKDFVLLGEPDMTTDWCMSQPKFVGNQLWVHCDDAGAMVLEFTNGVGPK